MRIYITLLNCTLKKKKHFYGEVEDLISSPKYPNWVSDEIKELLLIPLDITALWMYFFLKKKRIHTEVFFGNYVF